VFDGVRIEVGYRIDLLVERIVVVEVKSSVTLSNLPPCPPCPPWFKVSGEPMVKHLIRRFKRTVPDGRRRLSVAETPRLPTQFPEDPAFLREE
jgi:hypothetical protein